MPIPVEIHVSRDPLQYDLCNVEVLTTGVQYLVRLTFPAGIEVDAASLSMKLTSQERVIATAAGASKAASGVNCYELALFIPTGIVSAISLDPIISFDFSVTDASATYVTSTLPVTLGEVSTDPQDPYDLAPRVTALEEAIASLQQGTYTASNGVKIVDSDIQLTHNLAAAVHGTPTITDASTIADVVAVLQTLQSASK